MNGNVSSTGEYEEQITAKRFKREKKGNGEPLVPHARHRTTRLIVGEGRKKYGNGIPDQEGNESELRRDAI